MLGVLVQEQRLGLGIELEGVEAVHTVLRGPGRVVRAEENLPSSVAAEILDQFSRVAASLVGGGVDVDVDHAPCHAGRFSPLVRRCKSPGPGAAAKAAALPRVGGSTQPAVLTAPRARRTRTVRRSPAPGRSR